MKARSGKKAPKLTKASANAALRATVKAVDGQIAALALKAAPSASQARGWVRALNAGRISDWPAGFLVAASVLLEVRNHVLGEMRAGRWA